VTTERSRSTLLLGSAIGRVAVSHPEIFGNWRGEHPS
jgi:hypothetical protein